MSSFIDVVRRALCGTVTKNNYPLPTSAIIESKPFYCENARQVGDGSDAIEMSASLR
jgi:hypothetical protein